jgi:hypothetical protein
MQLRLAGIIAFVALFASSAKAVQITVDPGMVGGPVNDIISFVVPPPGAVFVDLSFANQKTLTFGPGPLSFALTRVPAGGLGPPFVGALADENGDEIPGTGFTGVIDAGVITLDLASQVTWSGMRFASLFDAIPLTAYSLVWTSKPTVGQLPEPGTAALLGLGLAGIGWLRRRSR